MAETEIFTIKSNEIVGRLDSQSYSFEIQTAKKKINSIKFQMKSLKEIVFFRKEIVSESNEIYLGLENVESNTGVYIKNNEKNVFGSAFKFYKNDVLFPKLRPYLNKVHYVIFDGVCSTEFYVLNSKLVDNRFLFIFLSSDMILNQTKNLMTGNTLPRLQIYDIENLKIPIPPKPIQEKIISIMDKAYKFKKENEEKAKNLIESIDEFILEKLEIKIPELKEEITFIVNSKELENKRIDCEFHQTKYKQIERALKNGKYYLEKIKELVEYIKKGVEVGSNEYLENGKIFLRVADFDNFNIYEKKFKYISNELYEKNKNFQPKKDEVIFSKDGSIGFSYVLEKDLKGIISSGIIRIKTKEIFDNYFLSYILKNKYIKLLFKNLSIGVIIKHLSVDEFKDLKIPFPPLNIQKQISNEVKKRLEKARILKQEAKELLEKSKLEVEKILLEEK